MSSNIKTVAYYLIAVGFLIYAALRLLGAVPGFAHMMGWWDNPIGAEIASKLGEGWPKLSSIAIVDISIEAYMGWSLLMGVVLFVGATIALLRRRVGLILIGVYYALFGLMFLNYPSISVKLVHYGVGLAFLALLFVLFPRQRTDSAA